MAADTDERRNLAGRLHELLVVRGSAGSDDDFPDQARAAVPTSFFRLLASTFLTQLGDVLSGPKVTLAWLMGALGAPGFLLALLVPIRESGALLPQLALAGLVRRFRVRKWLWVGAACMQGAAISAIGLCALVLEGARAGWAIVACLIVFSLARALGSIVSKDVLGRTIPKSQRGQTSGWAATAAGMITVLSGALLMHFGGTDPGVSLYALILIGASALWFLAAATYGGIREHPDTRARSEGARSTHARLDLLRSDPVLRRFVIARSLLLCSALCAPFFVAVAQGAQGTTPLLLGAFIVASGLASLTSAPAWGRLADRSSRRVMVIAAILAAASGIVVFAVHVVAPAALSGTWLMASLYFVLSIGHQGTRIGRKTYVVDIASGDRRTDYVAVSNSAIGLALLLAGLISAAAAAISAPLAILLLSLMGVAGALLAHRLPEAEGLD